VGLRTLTLNSTLALTNLSSASCKQEHVVSPEGFIFLPTADSGRFTLLMVVAGLLSLTNLVCTCGVPANCCLSHYRLVLWSGIWLVKGQ
jgi:hypothetical protein